MATISNVVIQDADIWSNGEEDVYPNGIKFDITISSSPGDRLYVEVVESGIRVYILDDINGACGDYAFKSWEELRENAIEEAQ